MAKTARVRGDTGDLWRRYRRGRRRALRDQLVELYLPLVREVAYRFAARLPPSVDPDDLVSAGSFGLVEAIENYDPNRGVRFETFCRKRVSGAMLDELRRLDWIPREARERADHLRRTMQSLRDALGHEPAEEDLAAAMAITPRTVREILQDLAFANSLPLDREGVRTGPEPIDGEEPWDVVARGELFSLVERQLSHREREIVHGYYHDRQTMKRIGTTLRLSESRVCQMHTRMLSRLKARLCEQAAP